MSNAIEFYTPNGRLVQGSFSLQQEKDDKGQPKVDDKGQPVMSIFFSMAYPKLLNGAVNMEFAAFRQQIGMAAQQAWPQFFPNGFNPDAPNFGCMHPQFSMKIVDGDGVDTNGKANKDKPGFAGHWIVKFKTNFDLKVFNDGQFQPHQVLPKPDDVFKRGFYGRVHGKIQGNGATGTQKPGIAIYPDFVVFTAQGEEIRGGVDVEDAVRRLATASATLPGMTAAPLAQPGTGMPTLPAPTSVAMPTLPAPGMPSLPVAMPTLPAEPQVSPAIQAQFPGITYAQLKAQGHTDEVMRTAGWII